jgi:hypothetical protein
MNVGLKADVTMQGCIPNAEGMKGSKAEVMVTSRGKVTDVDQNDIALFLMDPRLFMLTSSR